MANYPFIFVVFAIIAYGIAFRVYGKWYDRTVWKPDPKRTTPAHMYMDGVEYFPVSKYVLWGYQFKSIAALGPILGPFVALSFGWLPALIWIILGNFFIGWLQDYGAIMVSVRNEGRSFGPISYELTGPKGRNTLLGFLLFYMIIISAVFIYLVATFWNIFPTTFVATLGIFATGILAGRLLYKYRINVVRVTILALVLIVVSIFLGRLLPIPSNFLGNWTIAFWAVVVCGILFAGSILPMPVFIQPVNYVSFFPTYLAIILILIGALLSPITNISLVQASFKGFYPDPNVGPLWPILFVAIACGAISGWHSLVGSSTTSKQLDIETDAHPVGAGSMLSEGLLALASVSCYMVLTNDEMKVAAEAAGGVRNIGSWVYGAVKLTSAYFGGGEAVKNFLTTYFGVVLVIYALTVQALVTRFWRLISAEVFGQNILGQKYPATFVGLLIPWIFAITGSWINLWLYFGGSNQLLAGLAIMLITIHLARVKSPSIYTLIPATFMIITTLAALLWEIYDFTRAVLGYLGVEEFTKFGLKVAGPLAKPSPDAPYPYPTISVLLNSVFILVGVMLFLLGLRMAYYTYKAYFRFKAEPTPAMARESA